MRNVASVGDVGLYSDNTKKSRSLRDGFAAPVARLVCGVELCGRFLSAKLAGRALKSREQRARAPALGRVP